MLRFAVVCKNHPAFTYWQVHRADCGDIRSMVIQGAFVEYIVDESAEAAISGALERLRSMQLRYERTDFSIMPCCISSSAGGGGNICKVTSP